MANRVKQINEVEHKRLVLEEFLTGEAVELEVNIGVIKTGQVLAQNTSTGKWEQYDDSGSNGLDIPRRIYKGEEELDTDASSDGLVAVVLREGRVDRDLVEGLDYKTDYTGTAELERNRIYLEEVLDNETN